MANVVVKVQYSPRKVTGTALGSRRKTNDSKALFKKETLMATGWRVVIQSEENSKEDTLVLSTLCVSVLTTQALAVQNFYYAIICRPT